MLTLFVAAAVKCSNALGEEQDAVDAAAVVSVAVAVAAGGPVVAERGGDRRSSPEVTVAVVEVLLVDFGFELVMGRP